MKKPCCYYCIHWDADNASAVWNGTDNESVAYCTNPDKQRPDTGSEPCPCLSNDFCTGFEPTSGWDDAWQRAYRRCIS